MLLNSLVPRISSEDFDEIRCRHRIEVMDKLSAQLNKSRVMMPDYDSRRQFMEKFFSFQGMPEYF